MMRRMLMVGAVVALAGCGGGSAGGSAKPEDQIRSTVLTFAKDVVAGENGRACELTTDPDKCLTAFAYSSGMAGPESTKDKFRDAKVTSVTISPDGKTATVVTGADSGKVIKRGDHWLVVVE